MSKSWLVSDNLKKLWNQFDQQVSKNCTVHFIFTRSHSGQLFLFDKLKVYNVEDIKKIWLRSFILYQKGHFSSASTSEDFTGINVLNAKRTVLKENYISFLSW